MAVKNGAIQPGLRGYQPCCPARQEAPLIIDIGILAFFANLVLGERVWQGKIQYGQDLTPTRIPGRNLSLYVNVVADLQVIISREPIDGIPRKVKKPRKPTIEPFSQRLSHRTL